MRNIVGSFLAFGILVGLSTAACSGSSDNGGDDSSGGGPKVDGGGATSDGGGSATGDGGAPSDGGKVVDAPPKNAAVAVSFLDVDIAAGEVGGIVKITKAADESDIDSYEIYGADDSGAKEGSSFIGSVPASGKNVTFVVPDGSAIKTGVTKIVVLSKNSVGEMATGPTGRYADATPHKVALQTFYGGASLTGEPRIAFDEANRKLMIVSAPGIYMHCALDGSTCTATDITQGHDFANPARPAVDDVHGSVLLAAATTATRTNGFVIPTTFDGVSSPAVDFTDPTVAGSGLNPAAVVDSVRHRLLNVVRVTDTVYGTNTSGSDVLYDCDFGMTACNRRDIGVGATPTAAPASSGNSPTVAFDAAAQMLYVVGLGPVKADAPPFLLVCPTASSGTCTGRDDMIPVSTDYTLRGPVTPVIDSAGSKLDLIVQSSLNSPEIYRCNLDGSSCATPIPMQVGSTKTLASGTRAIGDDLNHKVLAVGMLQGAGATPGLFRCGMDGSSCELASTATGNQYYYVDITVDPESGQAFVAGYSNDGQLYLLYME